MWKDVGGDTNRSSSLLIDAETGLTLRDNVRAEHRAEFEAILRTLTVGALDELRAPWPYSDQPPSGPTREVFADFSFIRPAHDTGLEVFTMIGDPGGGGGLSITNGRSSLGIYVDSETGKLMKNPERLLPDDREVFERWAATVKLCGRDMSC